MENFYLTVPGREETWTRAGDEFGSEKVTVFIVIKELYGLKTYEA